MDSNRAVVGIFSYLDDTLDAVRSMKKSNMEYRVYSPVPRHELEEETFPQKSPVRIVSLCAAITGLFCGYALAILCSLDWPLRTSAKNIASIPAFFVPGYEWTILFGGVSTLFALLFWCRIPSPVRAVGYDPRFTHDKFGVVVGCTSNQVEDVKRRLTEAGAEEVKVEDAI